MTGKKEELNPLIPGQFNIYACGPTVYNYFHIGNARPFIVFDTLRRYLEYRGYKVNFVQNFTDVDDKMIRVAAEEGITVKELGDRYIGEYFKDAEALNIRPATVHPKATEHIGDIIALVKKLVDTGHAYELHGDVYFDTQSFPGYGRLSGQDLSELEMGARIDINEEKKNPMDFALWKAKKEGEIAWPSPWGEGRPGWHIECSAMSMKYLGDTLDIHGGGQDLKFPHHENEIAQSEAATGKPFANYWMHNGYINIDNRKMSKSAGNFFTVRDILKEFRGPAVRLFMLSAHYRNPINFSRELLTQSETAYDRILNCRENLKFIMEHPKDEAVEIAPVIAAASEKFNAAMDDDLNTADAIGGIFEYIKEINTLFESGGRAEDAKAALTELDTLMDVLGILSDETGGAVPEDVREMAEKRQEARAKKNWAEADRLRDEVRTRGYELKDTPDGVKINKI
ncbi:cysteine--tRNA ligase [Christensenella minuta]|uniref:Cysteine--tRNA ligase n=2 Tax=Christensenella minuta TaxID=626937 RepID=A0A136Q5E6_9FIRM|nr:cysteine--tRNA ligase [Christensenella minuta]